jgi:hypothetical protein
MEIFQKGKLSPADEILTPDLFCTILYLLLGLPKVQKV